MIRFEVTDLTVACRIYQNTIVLNILYVGRRGYEYGSAKKNKHLWRSRNIEAVRQWNPGNSMTYFKCLPRMFSSCLSWPHAHSEILQYRGRRRWCQHPSAPPATETCSWSRSGYYSKASSQLTSPPPQTVLNLDVQPISGSEATISRPDGSDRPRSSLQHLPPPGTRPCSPLRRGWWHVSERLVLRVGGTLVSRLWNK